MALAATIGALGDVGGSLFTSALSGHNARKNMRYQAALNYKYAQKSAENSPTWTRKGLTDAGYNPMLAVQNATSGANSSWSGLNNSEVPDFANSISTGVANAQSFQHLKNETEQAKANVKASEATAENQRAEAANKREENPYISSKMKSEIGKMDSETEYNQAAIENMQSRIELDRELGYLQNEGVHYMADQGYKGTVYNADKMKEVSDKHSPSGRSLSFKNYASGAHDIMSGVSDFLPYKFAKKGFKAEDFDETTRVVRDKNETSYIRRRRHK